MKTLRAYALAGAALAGLLSACVSKPPTPSWELEAHSASERAVKAYFKGQTRVAEVEWQKAFNEVAATGQPSAMARMALLQCAAQVSALEVSDCPRYQRYAAGADEAEQAYARYLNHRHTAEDVPLLPAAQQQVAVQLLSQSLAITLPASAEPLSQLTAAGVALRAGAIDLQGVREAVRIASEQGWRRAVTAWLLVEKRWAQEAGDVQAAEALELRLQVLQEQETSKASKK
ncbi:hypothetical protein [Comamonas sp. NoAH]|uniref:hypothetical protein n=1 Tax=Comamonas halotolerans TaxID=3041496 RepID=UPI0024E1518A|nr:hypothetical protein [Comamonas sp. NoAH]